MVLTNAEGSRFELRVQGYEFPEIKDNEYDSNWLIVKIHVKHPQGSWEVEEPCLLTWEVEALAEWLLKIADGTATTSKLDFMEPELEFHLLSDTSSLRVYFEIGFRPDWAPWDRRMRDLWLDFPLTDLDLAAVQSLHQQLQAFPLRAIQ